MRLDRALHDRRRTLDQERRGGNHVGNRCILLVVQEKLVFIGDHNVARTTLREIGRVVKRGGVLYVAVPDASTLTDRIYRWLARGGGHVNAFRTAQDVIAPVECLTGLRHRATRRLYSSLSFLNRRNRRAPAPRRMALFLNGSERYLAVLMWVLRGIDRRLGTRLSVYGWEFHFGDGPDPERAEAWINVCVRCGSGFPETYLRAKNVVRRLAYRCPECGGFNLLSRAK